MNKLLSKILIFSLIFLTVSGCKNDGITIERTASPSNSFDNEEAVAEESFQEEEIQVQIIDEADSKGVKFSIREGYCLDKEGNKVVIETEELKNCANFSNKNLEEIDLNKKKLKYFGANFKGSDLSKNKVNYFKIVWYEDQIDETTLFPHEGNKLNKALGKQHNRATKNILKQNKKRLAQAKKLIEANRELKAEYLAEDTTEKRKKKIIKIMKKNKKKITRYEQLVNDYNQKSSRHKDGAKMYLVKVSN